MHPLQFLGLRLVLLAPVILGIRIERNGPGWTGLGHH
jgi:hypothetical protein